MWRFETAEIDGVKLLADDEDLTVEALPATSCRQCSRRGEIDNTVHPSGFRNSQAPHRSTERR